MKTSYNKLATTQYFELMQKGHIILNGRYSQELKICGTLSQYKQYHSDNMYLEDQYNRHLIWKYGRKFYVTYGNN